MKERWFIRSIFIALLTLCVVAWVGSYWKTAGVSWMTSSTASSENFFGLNVHWGTVDFESYGFPAHGFPKWYSVIQPASRKFTQQRYQMTKYHFAGFAYEPNSTRPVGWVIYFPLWFPTLVSALLLWLVWRKTRPKYNGRGFPVELTAK